MSLRGFRRTESSHNLGGFLQTKALSSFAQGFIFLAHLDLSGRLNTQLSR